MRERERCICFRCYNIDKLTAFHFFLLFSNSTEGGLFRFDRGIYDQFQLYAAMEYDDERVNCPFCRADCFHSRQQVSSWVHCKSCNRSHCKVDREEWNDLHSVCTLPPLVIDMESSKKQRLVQKEVAAKSPCPNCKHPLRRTGSFSHMTCEKCKRRSCSLAHKPPRADDYDISDWISPSS